ncbi:hypothetical protein [Streptomyces sp. NPDC051636]|uniref:hypothetical protein n=1 Tax=Streptomyces sp. NPDC051636 TaxID=3365663 RepID=UPI0037A57240
MRPDQHTEYIVQCIRESGSMYYEDDARSFLAEHDAHIRAEALAEARTAAAAEQLVDDTDHPGDQGYRQAIDDVVSALTQLAEGDGREVTPLVVSRFDVAMEHAPEETPGLTVGGIAEDGRPVALVFDEETRAKVAGWLAPTADAASELTVYRASHDSIVMGLYTTAAEARKHCETELRREWPNSLLDWIEDEEDGGAELVAESADGETETGYIVTALTVASAYDEEDDE